MAKSNPFQSFEPPVDIKDRNTWQYAENVDASAIFENIRRGPKIRSRLLKDALPLFFGGLFLFFIVLWGRLLYLQLFQGEQYRASAEINRIREVVTKSPRGLIYDRNGQILLRNIPNFILTVTPADLPEDVDQRHTMLQEVAQIVSISVQQLEEEVNDDSLRYSYQPLVVQEHIPYDTALLLMVRTKHWPGIGLDILASREYLKGKYWSHVLGYIGSINEEEYRMKKSEGYLLNDSIGKVGLEESYESVLRGQYGRKQIEVDSLRKEQRVIAQQEAVSGNGLSLTLDDAMQQFLGEKLEKKLEELPQATGATAVAVDPNNGEILALVSVPAFDNNLFVSGLPSETYEQLLLDEKRPLFHRSISGQYPSGSTFKMVVGSAALEEGVVSSSTRILSSGGIRIGEWFFPDWKAGGHGPTDMRKALAESVNTYFYTIGGGWQDIKGLGVERIDLYARRFGLGSTLGIDIKGEAAGLLPTKEWKLQVKGEPWYIGDTYHVSIGQGDILVTPLQVAQYTSIIANGGQSFRPHLVRKILSPEGQILQEKQPEIISKQVVRTENIQVVREGLRQSVTSGSGRRLAELPLPVAGKTGSAQGSNDHLHAWFTSFAPYEKPEIVLTILIENGGEGSSVAVPVAYDFYQWYEQYRRS